MGNYIVFKISSFTSHHILMKPLLQAGESLTASQINFKGCLSKTTLSQIDPQNQPINLKQLYQSYSYI